ncbi:MAG: T9SS type A sorting domain-containing protein, partial [Bacteroidia bacterium]
GPALEPSAYLLIREGFVEPRSGFEVETIYSLSGQVVWRQSNAPVQWPIALAPGVYIMHGRAENRHLRYKVIVP